MGMRGGRGIWVFSIPVLMLALGMAGVGVIVWRGLGPRGSRILDHVVRILVGRTPSAQGQPTGPSGLDDPLLSPLRKALESWRRVPGPNRRVVDQVCLVSDEAAFLEAIAAWDERTFFPILIDDPAWTLPFLRAFRPARVIRSAGRARTLRAQSDGRTLNSLADGEERWLRALEAVSRAWSGPSESERVLPAAGLPPRWLEGIPPGLVLADPRGPMLAGAVALAAGRFQPLIGLQLSASGPQKEGEPGRNWRFGDVLSIAQASELARGRGAGRLGFRSLRPARRRVRFPYHRRRLALRIFV